MHCLSSVYSAITPLHVSGVSAVHHQEVECIYVANGTCYASEMTVIKYNSYHLTHIYILPPDAGLLMSPKHVEV
jgi:hypothetical protein